MKKLLSRSRLLTALLFLCLLLVLFIQVKRSYNFYDEGFALTGAQRVLDGDAPYRDFWAIYPPGQFYAIAGVFKLFGSNVLVSRTYDTLLRFLTVVAVYGIARKIAGLWMARLAALAIGLLLAAAWFYSYAVFPALGLGLGAMLCWLHAAETGRRRWMVLTGILLGLAMLVRWDIGAYAALSIATAGYGLLWLGSGQATPLFQPLKRLVWAGVPLLAIGGAGYTAVGLNSGWQNLYEQVFYFPVAVLPSVRRMPYPALLPGGLWPSGDWMRFYLPLLALGLALALSGLYLARGLRARSCAPITPASAGLLALALFGLLLFNQALSRYDSIHVLPSMVATFLAAAALYAQSGAWFRSRGVRWIVTGVLVILTALFVQPSLKTLANSLATFPPWGCFSKLEKAACVAIDPNQESAVQYLQSVTRPDEAIFAGNSRHDKIFVNDAGFYYLADRPIATRYNELHPAVANTLPVQQEIIAGLEAQAVQWIVLVDIWEANEPNGSSVSSGVTALDQHLRAHYRAVTQVGIYQIYQRRP